MAEKFSEFEGLESVQGQSSLFISALGYEKRCVHIAKKFEGEFKYKIALDFGDYSSKNYMENRDYYTSNGFDILTGFDSSKVVINELDLGVDENVDVVILDISSMSRVMIANVLLLIDECEYLENFELFLLYSPSKYSPPPAEDLYLRYANPVRDEFAGWSSNIGAPLTAVIGLGYERDLAVSVLERLEADRAIAMLPKGGDVSFYTKLVEVNSVFLNQLSDTNRYVYDINRPSLLYSRLTSLLSSLSSDGRVVVVPMGPKIFAGVALLIQTFSPFPETSVWRFSSGQSIHEREAVPTGDVIGCRVLISSS